MSFVAFSLKPKQEMVINILFEVDGESTISLRKFSPLLPKASDRLSNALKRLGILVFIRGVAGLAWPRPALLGLGRLGLAPEMTL